MDDKDYEQCHSCGKIIPAGLASLDIRTEDMLLTFCYTCIKKSAYRLMNRKFKSPEEIALLMELRRFLKGVGQA